MGIKNNVQDYVFSTECARDWMTCIGSSFCSIGGARDKFNALGSSFNNHILINGKKMQVKNIDYAKIDGIVRKDRSSKLSKHANLAIMLGVMYFIAHILVWGVL